MSWRLAHHPTQRARKVEWLGEGPIYSVAKVMPMRIASERIKKLDTYNEAATDLARRTLEKRGQPRFKLEVDIKVSTRTWGLLKGYTVDISESGISAIVKLEVPLGELVELDFTLPYGPVTIYAMVCQRNAFRYGFQFVQSNLIRDVIRPTCRELAMEQSLFSEP